MSRPTASLLARAKPKIQFDLRQRVRAAEAEMLAMPSSSSSTVASSSSSPSSVPLSSSTTSPTATPGSPPRSTYKGGPYIVRRSENGQLPVYTDTRASGSWRTVIRRVQGDVTALRTDLNNFFRENHVDPLSSPPQAIIRPNNGHLVIKGKHSQEVKGWMQTKGF